MDATKIKPGKLIRTRGREWVILPTDDKDLLKIKPLGGTEEETTCIYLPFQFPNEQLEEVYFPVPNTDDIGDLQSAKLLYDALRLSFRDASGPFRSMAKYNFTPRAYQMVPMIMALRQEDPVRLFIADDVGIGKTIESLMIARELFDRRVVKGFSVVCLPHLCDQWAAELNQKFGFNPVIIRSSTEAQLRRKIPAGIPILQFYPFTVVSIDFIKGPRRSAQFLETCPKLVVVDEIHTCTQGQGKGRQLRHELIKKLSEKEDQHLVLLSATPHSGKPEQFQSILSFLKPEFGQLDLGAATRKERELVAKHYVQRRRADIEKWVGDFSNEETPFPERKHFEVGFEHSSEYIKIQMGIINMARKIATRKEDHGGRTKLNYWTALGLIRGVMSSPRMGIAMLEKRATKSLSDEEANDLAMMENPIIEDDFSRADDNAPNFLLSTTKINNDQWKELKQLSIDLSLIEEKAKDTKITQLVKVIQAWQKEGLQPIVYCRYINTAKYVGDQLNKVFGKKRAFGVLTVTSEDPDDLRKEKVDSLAAYNHRILVATDCMSEGINLQELFTAVIHYDLPWNPNRLEQREGRVDRFGQNAPVVKTALLYATNSPMDGIILNVLIKKAREIKKSIGISVPFPENNQSIIETITNAVLLKGVEAPTAIQLGLFDQDPQLLEADQKVANSYKEIEKIEKATRSIFAQHAVKAQDIESDLEEAIRLVGDMASVENFAIRAVRHLGGDIQNSDNGYVLYKAGLPPSLFHLFEKDHLKIMFKIPLVEGFKYVARNHPLIDALSQILIAESRKKQSKYGVSRAAVIRHNSFETTTTVALFRVRNVIESLATKDQIVAEELHLWGYQGEPNDNDWLDEKTCMELLDLKADGEVAFAERIDFFEDAMEEILDVEELRNNLARKQAEKLIEAHDRFRQAVRSRKEFQVVEPILPMDIMGVYVFVPNQNLA
jgi:superfamily II DNA or RNA helicase